MSHNNDFVPTAACFMTPHRHHEQHENEYYDFQITLAVISLYAGLQHEENK